MSYHLSTELGRKPIAPPMPYDQDEKDAIRPLKNKIGIYFATLTITIILCGDALMTGLIYLTYPFWNSGITHIVLYQCLVIVTISSHLRTSFTDPGKARKWSYNPRLVKRAKRFKRPGLCAHCYTLMPHRSHHCSVCQRCILKMDHHCFFINNCVGLYNQKFFFLLTMYGTLTALYTLGLCVAQVTFCTMDGWGTCLPLPLELTVAVLLGLIIFSLAISGFVGGLFCKQVFHIFTDTTFIEQLKKEEPRWKVKTPWESVKSVFGPFSLCWFVPISKPKLEHPYVDQVYHNTYP